MCEVMHIKDYVAANRGGGGGGESSLRGGTRYSHSLSEWALTI